MNGRVSIRNIMFSYLYKHMILCVNWLGQELRPRRGEGGRVVERDKKA
jgi:hypothetical protein